MSIVEFSSASADISATNRGMPLRICLLGYRSNPRVGGQGVYLHHLSRALVEEGHRVDVVSGPPYPKLDPRVGLVKMPGLDLYQNGLGSLQLRHLGSFANIVEWLSKLSGGFAEPWTFCYRVSRWFARHAADYDVVQDNQSLGYGLLSLQRRGLPLVGTIHHPITRDLALALDAAPNWRRRLLVRRWYSFLGMQKRVVRQMSCIMTVSHSAKRDIAADFSVPEECITVVHGGIDTDLYHPQPEVQRRPCRLMATASSDHPLKGLRYLLLACQQLARDFPSLELVVIGRAEPGGVTERLIAKRGLTGRVRFLSGLSSEEIARLYAEATIAVVPSLYEGFGFPAGEAMACGTPVVSTDGGALPEVVGDAAEVVSAGNADALAAAIAALLRDPKRREHLGTVGRQRILKNFSWRKAASETVALYRQAIVDARTEQVSATSAVR